MMREQGASAPRGRPCSSPERRGALGLAPCRYERGCLAEPGSPDVPRSTAPRRRSGPSRGSRTRKGSPAKKRKSAKGRRAQRTRRGRRAALLVVLVAAVVVGWQAAGQHLPALPFLGSIAGGPT